MPRIAVYFGLPLLVTILFMFALRPLARGMGLIDRPGGRKHGGADHPPAHGAASLRFASSTSRPASRHSEIAVKAMISRAGRVIRRILTQGTPRAR